MGALESVKSHELHLLSSLRLGYRGLVLRGGIVIVLRRNCYITKVGFISSEL